MIADRPTKETDALGRKSSLKTLGEELIGIYALSRRLERQRDAAVEALKYAVKQVPELGTVPGIATVLAEIAEGK